MGACEFGCIGRLVGVWVGLLGGQTYEHGVDRTFAILDVDCTHSFGQGGSHGWRVSLGSDCLKTIESRCGGRQLGKAGIMWSQKWQPWKVRDMKLYRGSCAQNTQADRP